MWVSSEVLLILIGMLVECSEPGTCNWRPKDVGIACGWFISPFEYYIFQVEFDGEGISKEIVQEHCSKSLFPGPPTQCFKLDNVMAFHNITQLMRCVHLRKIGLGEVRHPVWCLCYVSQQVTWCVAQFPTCPFLLVEPPTVVMLIVFE